MFNNITESYTLSDASLEIGIMLLGAFTLGFVLAWLIKPSKQYTKTIISHKDAGYAHKKSAVPKVVAEIKKQEIGDDLKLIEGIGPKIEKHLQKYKITTFKDIVRQDVEGLESIMSEGGARLAAHSPTTWPDQAKLASEGKWSELEEYQDILNAGRKK